MRSITWWQILLIIAAGASLVLAGCGGGPIYCDVTADQMTTLPGPIYVLPTGGNPPPPA